MIWFFFDVFRKINGYYWLVIFFYYGNDVIRVLIFFCVVLVGRNLVWNLRMLENNNSNYYLCRVVCTFGVLRLLVIFYSEMGMLVRMSII